MSRLSASGGHSLEALCLKPSKSPWSLERSPGSSAATSHSASPERLLRPSPRLNLPLLALRSPRLAFPHRLPLWIHSPPTSLAFPVNTSIIQYHLVVFQEGGCSVGTRDTSVSKTDTQMHPPSACIPDLCLKGTVCCAKSLQSCLTLCDAMDCSPPVSSVLGILQARILE